MALIFIIYPNWEGYKVPIPPQNCIIAVAIYIHKWVASFWKTSSVVILSCCNLHTQVGCQCFEWMYLCISSSCNLHTQVGCQVVTISTMVNKKVAIYIHKWVASVFTLITYAGFATLQSTYTSGLPVTTKQSQLVKAQVAIYIHKWVASSLLKFIPWRLPVAIYIHKWVARCLELQKLDNEGVAIYIHKWVASSTPCW